ncbi:MAG: YhbY family RNA-binding protein [Aquabacterium sp.]
MPALVLSPAQRKAKRGEAHHLTPVAMIGSGGMTDAVVREVDAALNAHSLIKVRVLSDDRAERETMLAALSDRLGAAPVQHLGKMLLLWRPLPAKAEAPREERKPGPRVVKIVKFGKNATHRPQVTKVRVMGNERVTDGGLVKRAKVRHASVKKQSQDR